jgi:hypothetical protein
MSHPVQFARMDGEGSAVHAGHSRNSHRWTMWTRYDHGEKRIRRADIVAIWAIVVGFLLAAAACSGL